MFVWSSLPPSSSLIYRRQAQVTTAIEIDNYLQLFQLHSGAFLSLLLDRSLALWCPYRPWLCVSALPFLSVESCCRLGIVVAARLSHNNKLINHKSPINMIASCKNNLIYGFAIICQSSLADDMTTRWIIILVGMGDLLLLLWSSWRSQVLRRLFNDMQIMENINSLAKKTCGWQLKIYLFLNGHQIGLISGGQSQVQRFADRKPSSRDIPINLILFHPIPSNCGVVVHWLTGEPVILGGR